MGPRVYNVFPTLAGPTSQWPEHFQRAAAMGFDWIYLNPIHETGGSGSLYAVRDYYRLNPLLRGDDTRSDDELIREVVAAAERCGLSIILDLVINHTANDSPLADEHPGWYARTAGGTLVAPSAIDPAAPQNVTVWGDLAELDYSERPERAEMIRYFSEVVRHYVGLGVRGFRCDAAYKVPAAAWSEIVAAGREIREDVLFTAETLGCRLEEVAQLGGAGFDYLFNSSKWWDFRSDWLLEQYEQFRHIAPSIAFPESHDTPRLAAELAGKSPAEMEAEYRFRYLFAAFFSSGVMLPMGYEFGFERKLDVVTTRPGDFEAPRFDLQTFIASVNAMKAALPALNEEGAQRRLMAAGDALALLRQARSTRDLAMAVLNPSTARPLEIDIAALSDALGANPRDVTPGASPRNGAATTGSLVLAPLEMRVFRRDPERAGEAGSDTAKYAHVPTRVAVIENVTPMLDEGRHPVKRVVRDEVVVEADVFREGHDVVAAALLYRERGAPGWQEAPLRFLANDRWQGRFRVERNVPYEFTIEAWPDPFEGWRHDVEKKRAAGQAIDLELLEGRALVEAAQRRAHPAEHRLEDALAQFDAETEAERRADFLLGDRMAHLMARTPDRSAATRFEPVLGVDVDRRAAQFAAWYELFPRSQSGVAGVHGTFADAAHRLSDIRAMGFDVVYLPPIHPIGHAFRKGRNNTLDVAASDPGSPWAIGNECGGHMAVEPQLGTLADFDRFVAAARRLGLEVALDYALQCSPDHPFVTEHPEWFVFRPDGSIKYAENPPKKYQDIVNFNWFGPDAATLWDTLRDVILFWVGHGVTMFRVDNPHTKPFAFWQWLIADVRAKHPQTLFLAEAFTRPKVMNELAKIGFSQSYTYFTWRNTKAELTEYVTELAHGDPAEFYRPNFWPNTPDILPPYLQTGGRAAFRIRLILAATLSSLYGIYSGFELCENAALPGREEYADSEKYEIKVRDWNAPGNIKADITRINRIRRENAALHDWRNVTFYRADDDAVLFYGKRHGDDVLLIAVNLDPFAAHDPVLWLPTGDLGYADDEYYELEELLGATLSRWRGSPHRWRLDPQHNPAAIFRLRAASRSAAGTAGAPNRAGAAQGTGRPA